MNIKRAKQEIRDSIEAYLSKDEFGEYRIPAIRQRPILLMGPPGIGKTQIMEQIARECGIALVSYTITHHTRQSAVGLPFIVKKNYGEEEFSVTEYTMSEIISSVYDKMEKTGLKEGILFIDEINCVSETLAPMMLQFLQGKTFGNQKVPEGWVIVTAGNPPEYNKSVREFDVVTLDRIKKIDVEADFDVWKEYAYQQGIHPAVISYLELRRKNFYRVENTVDGKIFATARGWEDLSRLIQVYEILGKTVDREVVSQYIQHRMIAKDFAGYLALYYKYRTDYKVEDILKGKWDPITLGKIRTASLDEHLSIVSLLTESSASFLQNAILPMPISRNCMIIWCTSEKIRTASQQKISWKKQRRILKRTKRVSFLQNSRSVYRNVLCHFLKMRPDRNQPRDQLDRNQPDQIKPDQAHIRQEAEVLQQNRKIHRQTGTMSL